MLNSSLKKKWIADLESTTNEYKSCTQSVIQRSEFLLDQRQKSKEAIQYIEKYINSLANTPKEFEKEFDEINHNIKEFDSLTRIEYEANKGEKISGSVAGAGAVAGIGVAAFGPTSAMAIATTFGTASTGTAISTLSGAAATNAALAWLGGGALTAGGGGIVAGETLLALAGPVGWTIGGVALAGGALIANSKNKKVAQKAEKEVIVIEGEISKLSSVENEINEMAKLTIKHYTELKNQCKLFDSLDLNDYNLFNEEQKYDLGTLINNTRSLSKLMKKTIGEV